VQAVILRDQKIDSLRVKSRQKADIGVIVFASRAAKTGCRVVRNRKLPKFLEFRKLALCDEAPRGIVVPRYVLIVGVVNEQTDRMLIAEPDQFSKRLLDGLKVFEPDYDVCVDQQLEIVHRSAMRRIPA
jgi:hypothetical protein